MTRPGYLLFQLALVAASFAFAGMCWAVTSLRFALMPFALALAAMVMIGA